MVASVISPESPSVAASAVGPSSHGRWNSRWSFAHSQRYPSASARRVYARSSASVGAPPPKSISGRCAPYSIAGRAAYCSPMTGSPCALSPLATRTHEPPRTAPPL